MEVANRKFNNSAMLLSGRRQQDPTSSDMRMPNLLPINIITTDFTCLITGIPEARKRLRSPRPKMQLMGTQLGL